MKGMTPTEVYKFSLPIHRYLPAGERPVFHARYLSRGDVVQSRSMLEAIQTKLSEAQSDEEVSSIDDGGLVELLMFELVGWEGVTDAEGRALEFTAENLREHVVGPLDPADAWGIHFQARDAVRARRDELGNSD